MSRGVTAWIMLVMLTYRSQFLRFPSLSRCNIQHFRLHISHSESMNEQMLFNQREQLFLMEFFHFFSCSSHSIESEIEMWERKNIANKEKNNDRENETRITQLRQMFHVLFQKVYLQLETVHVMVWCFLIRVIIIHKLLFPFHSFFHSLPLICVCILRLPFNRYTHHQSCGMSEWQKLM